MTLIGMTTDDLKQLLSEAYAAGARSVVAPVEEQQLSTSKAMELAGYRDHAAFKKYCRENGIQPVAKRAKVNYYLSSEILNPPKRKRFGRL